MSNITKTISYFRRNGFLDTWNAIRERTDHKNIDPMMRLSHAYTGCDEIKEDELKKQKAYSFQKGIKFSILVPAYETSELYLKEMIDSVLKQSYSNLELVIADASESEQVKKVVLKYTDDRIKYIHLKENEGISANTNEALKYATGQYIGLLDHDDTLQQGALFEMAMALEGDDFAFVFSDEDKMNTDGTCFYEPHFKPDFNFDLLLSNNYICHFLVMKTELMKKLKFRKERDGAQDYDLVLRAVGMLIGEYVDRCGNEETAMQTIHAMFKQKIGHIDQVLYHWRCHEDSTAANPESKRYAYEAGLNALRDFTDFLGWNVSVKHCKHLGFYEIVYKDSIWKIRKDIAAIGGNVVKNKKVVNSPVLNGVAMFEGMNRNYSGYMHRASLRIDVESLPEENMMKRPGLELSVTEAVEKGMCLLYDGMSEKNR